MKRHNALAMWGRGLLVIALPWVLSAACAVPIECGGKPIRLAFYDYGLLYFDQGRGIDKDVVDELVKRSGCQFELQVMTRARIWADLASGDLDMSVSGIQNSERDRFAWFAHYLTMKNYALVHKDVAVSVRRAEDFIANPALQFGVVRAFRHGARQDQWLEPLRAANRVQESPSVEPIFRKLKDHRIDAMFSQPPVYRKYLQDYAMQDVVDIQDWTPAEKGVPHGLILAKSRFTEGQFAQWQKLVQEMRTDGTLRRIYHRYLPADEVRQLLDF